MLNKKRKKNPQFESMTRLHINDHSVRVWRTEKSLADAAAASNEDLRILAKAMEEKISGAHQIAEMIAVLPRVAAIEVLDYKGDGVLHYPDWS